MKLAKQHCFEMGLALSDYEIKEKSVAAAALAGQQVGIIIIFRVINSGQTNDPHTGHHRTSVFDARLGPKTLQGGRLGIHHGR